MCIGRKLSAREAVGLEHNVTNFAEAELKLCSYCVHFGGSHTLRLSGRAGNQTGAPEGAPAGVAYALT